MRVTKRFLLTVLTIICGTYFTSFAQQFATELKDLSKGADIVLTGKVIEQASGWNENKTRIYTQAIIQVDEYIKGKGTGNTVTVKYLGGEVGDVGEMYSHMPRFEDKEEVLVFLKKDEKSTDYKVFNGENGKISVINDPKTGEKVTTSNVQINSLKAQIKNYIND
ncbi:MAG: hypothetical protein WBQ32_13545 [Ignavibacteriaceae bacterium]